MSVKKMQRTWAPLGRRKRSGEVAAPNHDVRDITHEDASWTKMLSCRATLKPITKRGGWTRLRGQWSVSELASVSGPGGVARGCWKSPLRLAEAPSRRPLIPEYLQR
jgi:hypothetical protein